MQTTPADRPLVSVVIPTRNRRPMLAEALASLSAMDCPRGSFEVIVSDDGSTDGTGRLVADMVANFPCRLALVSPPARGVAAARNAGAAAAGGQVLVFSDDDCLFPPGWLAKLVRGLDDPGVGAVGVSDRAPADSPLFARCVDYTVNSLVGAGGVRHKRSLRMARYLPRGFGMAVRREVFHAVAGFDESLEAGEDVDLSFRIRQAGYRLRFEPDTFVWHRRRAGPKAFFRQMVTRGRTRVELIRRHPRMLEPAFLLPALLVLWFGLLLLSAWSAPGLQRLLGGTSAAYGAALLATGWRGAARLRDRRALALIAAITALQHIGYGYGTLEGFFDWLRRRGARSPESAA